MFWVNALWYGLYSFKLLLNGSLVQIEENAKTYIQPSYFCIDGLYYMKETEQRIFPGSEWDQVVIACTPTVTGTAQQVQVRQRLTI